MSESRQMLGLMAEFSGPEPIKEAARAIRDDGYDQVEAFTPMPVDGLADILDHQSTYVALLVLVGGLFGAGGAFAMQALSWVLDYPINIGGRPMFSWPSFIPITFELGVLFGAFTGGIGMLLLNRLPRLNHPVFEAPGFERATSDRFFLMISADDDRFDPGRTPDFMDTLGALSVSEVPRASGRGYE